MADAESLTHAFMRVHPAEAGRVLEGVRTEEAAALFARAPARLGQPVLAAMLPGAGARVLAALDEERAMELLGGLATQPAIALLRHVAEPLRSRLIAGLPTAAALASRLLLGFPDDAVGAWMDPDVIALPAETRAADALARARHVGAIADRVYVTADGMRLAGWVPLATLLRAPDGATLDSLKTLPEAVLSARSPLLGALAHPGWERSSALPVVEAGERLVGTLTRDALARALGRTADRARGPVEGSFLEVLARGYWITLSGLVEAAATLLPPLRPAAGPHDER